MNKEHEEYELGKDITRLAKSEGKRETAVISVRMTSDEVKRLEALGRESGKSSSQVIRDAIAAYEVKRPSVVVGLWSGSVVMVGEPEEISGTAGWEVTYTGIDQSHTGIAVAMHP